MSGPQLLGLLVGAFLGWVIAVAITGGKYRYLGGPFFEETKPPTGCFAGCLVQILLTGIGAGAGFFVASVAFK